MSAASMKHKGRLAANWAEFRGKSGADKRRVVTDLLFNNAMYIIIAIAVVYIAIRVPAFLSVSSIVNIISLTAAKLPIALGIGGAIVLTGTDISAGRVVGLTACISAALLQMTGYANKIFPNLKTMPLWVVRNVTFGNVAYSTFNEGLGKVMRFGANGPEVIARLRWLEKTLAPAMKSALALSGPISLKVLISKALTMGDEMHQRNIAASCLFIRTMAPWLVRSVHNAKALAEVMDFISGNDQFFLNLAMAAGKSTMDPVKNIPYSTIVTAMSRNGTNFGVKISALGDRWFQAPVLMPKGLYFPGYSEKDANPDMGDSAICETFGIGGVAMASAPAVVRFVGAKSVAEAMRYSRQMQQIAVGLNNAYIMPTMNFVGTATGLDAKKIVETGILPVINTGMAHKKAGVGQVGAGIVFAPPDCFAKAMEAFAAEYGAWR